MAEKVIQDRLAAYGLEVLLGNHPEVLKLKTTVRPLEHGHKVWTSSWLLIDYLQKTDGVCGSRVLDLGCGWGLAGIFCAKHFKTDVVWADIDAAVFPYLNLMANANQVNANFLNIGIEQVQQKVLGQVDTIIASDICFCDTLIDPLTQLINRAREAGAKHFIIADPGRWPFDDLAELLAGHSGVELLEWHLKKPREMTGKILKIRL